MNRSSTDCDMWDLNQPKLANPRNGTVTMQWKMVAMILAVLWLCGASAPAAEQGRVEVTDLRCESLEEPLGLDVSKPRLNWRIESPRRGQRQSAYQVLVASTAELLAQRKVISGTVARWPATRIFMLSMTARRWFPVRNAIGRCGYGPLKNASRRLGARGKMDDGFADADGLAGALDFRVAVVCREPSVRVHRCRRTAWAQVELDTSARIDSVKLYPHTGDTFPLRFRIEADDDIDFSHPKVITDCSGEDFTLGNRTVLEFPGQGIAAKRVRILILKPAAGKSNKSTIRQMEVWSQGRNVALMRRTLESGCNWNGGHSFFMVDGMPSANDGATCPDDACPTQTAPLLRKAFSLEKPVRRAVLYYAAHGLADISLNGAKVDDAVLAPRFSDYGQRIYYRTVDVTKQLRHGDNVVGATLGNGFFSTPGRGFGQRHNGRGQPRLNVQLEVELTDGTRKTIVSDESSRMGSQRNRRQ